MSEASEVKKKYFASLLDPMKSHYFLWSTNIYSFLILLRGTAISAVFQGLDVFHVEGIQVIAVYFCGIPE